MRALGSNAESQKLLPRQKLSGRWVRRQSLTAGLTAVVAETCAEIR